MLHDSNFKFKKEYSASQLPKSLTTNDYFPNSLQSGGLSTRECHRSIASTRFAARPVTLSQPYPELAGGCLVLESCFTLGLYAGTGEFEIAR